MQTKSRFVIQRHSTNKPHFDLRLILGDTIRCWSILKEPLCKPGEKRLAIERETLTLPDLNKATLYEDAFGAGKVYTWDEGEYSLVMQAPNCLVLELEGKKLSGRYELRLMRWYPGNRWLLKKMRHP